MLNNRGFLRKTHNCINLLINTHLFFLHMLFFAEKPAGGRTAEGLAEGFLSWHWRHPITLRSLAVRSTDVGPQFSKKLTSVFIVFFEVVGIIWDVSGRS